ncbi:MAG TPA: helix-turn-helix transcriptional regulator [Dissulfurispiraceae bacterium]|nr:helix-turn-helix transcriptional regulator [Dissulfurispiraceae bacterium]
MKKKHAEPENIIYFRQSSKKKPSNSNVRYRDVPSEKEKNLQVLFNVISDEILLVDLQGKCIAANKAFAKSIGRPAEELAGKSVFDLLTVDVAKTRMYYIGKASNSGKQVCFEDECRGLQFFHTIYPIFDRSGNVKRLAICSQSLGQRKYLEERLKMAYDELTVELREKTVQLFEANAALKALLKHREEEISEGEERVLLNVRELILPCIDRLRESNLSSQQESCLSLLEFNIREIVSSFSIKLSSQYLGLTHAEMHVANLIREGKSTKQIMEFCGISKATVDTYRYKIRTKLGLKNTKANLRSYLLSMK